MIDEKLYKLATDELNSDQRKPDIWARACVLASNDHDEARYLYTNLRVEQMLAEQAKKDEELARSGGLPDTDLAEDPPETPIAPEQPVAPEPLRAVESVRPGQTSDANLKADGLELDHPATAHSSVGSNDDKLELSLDDFDLDPDEVAQMNAAEPGNASALTGNLTSAKKPLETDDNFISMENDPLAYWAQQHQEQLRSGEQNHSASKDKALNEEFERQANELPGQHSDVVSVEPSADFIESEPPTTPAQHTSMQALDEHEPRSPVSTDAPVHYDYADDEIADHVISVPAAQATSGKRYYVFSKKGRSVAVKDGVSWTAMLFTLPWLLTKGLLGTAIVYTILWLVLAAGLISTGLVWLDTAPDASTAIKVWTLLFALIAVIALLYVPFRHGNKWLQQKLSKRGYELDSLVHAKNRKKAIEASIDSTLF